MFFRWPRRFLMGSRSRLWLSNSKTSPGEDNLLLIWTYASGHCCAERYLFIFSFVEDLWTFCFVAITPLFHLLVVLMRCSVVFAPNKLFNERKVQPSPQQIFFTCLPYFAICETWLSLDVFRFFIRKGFCFCHLIPLHRHLQNLGDAVRVVARDSSSAKLL